MKETLIEYTKKTIKKVLQESGYIENQESCVPLEDKGAVGYLDLEVSGNDGSEVEDDDDRDPEVEEAVGALEEEDAVGEHEEERDQAA